jgi:hypothetical protein
MSPDEIARILVSKAKTHEQAAERFAENAIDLLRRGGYSAAAADAHRAHQNSLIAGAFYSQANQLTDPTPGASA